MIEISDIFSEIALILLIASIMGILTYRLKQPLIVGFIAVGIILGPSSLGWVAPNDQIDLLAKLGISLLLFIVGLKLDLHIIRTMGPVALATGIGQVLFTALVGYFIAIALGFMHIESLYIAVALTFSSTIIIVKLLSDKGEVDTLHGRIAIGFLIVQDVLVIVAMIALNALSGGDTPGQIGPKVFTILINGTVFLIVVALLMRYFLTPLLNRLAPSNELLMLFSIAWAVALGALGHYLGFSREVGSFVAGVSLASTPYRDLIGGRLASLRDFLLVFFFVDLGATLELSSIGGQLGPALLFSLFVLIGNPLIVMVILGVMGYAKRTGFFAGLTVAQISEFSLILGALGVTLGHIGGQVLGLITLVGLVTICASTYMILYAQNLYLKLRPILGLFQRKIPYRETESTTGAQAESVDIIIFGMGRFGRTLLNDFIQKGYSALGIDYDPERIKKAKADGLTVRYGDAEDSEFVATLPWQQAKWIVNATHDHHINQNLSYALDGLHYPGYFAFTVASQSSGELLTRDRNLAIVPLEYAARQATATLLALDNANTPVS
jgi:Kef-type K+ transport system membrane component KefB